MIRVLFENRFHGIRKRHKCDHANEIPFPPGFSLHFAGRFRRSEEPCLLRKGHKAGICVTAFDRGKMQVPPVPLVFWLELKVFSLRFEKKSLEYFAKLTFFFGLSQIAAVASQMLSFWH